MFRLTAFLFGAAVFALAHVVEVIAWREVFAPGGDYAPWFLNSGRAVAFTAACLFVTGFAYALVAKATRDQFAAHVANLAAGAIVAMAGVLAVNGPGTLFPVALAIGALVAAAACASGGYLGWRLGSARG